MHKNVEVDLSVIIPIYNAQRFIHDAVYSALNQAEVREILLIDDGSTDNSRAVCDEIARENPHIIRVLRHPEGRNTGPAETRNVGLRNASCAFVAFLDADDVYLLGRFTETAKCFQAHPDADGVYETVLTRTFEDTGDSYDPRAGKVLSGFQRVIAPEILFTMLAKGNGYIHLNGLVIKKSALSDSLFFDNSLRQAEDTDFVMRLAIYRKLYSCSPDRIVAHRRVHNRNTVLNYGEALKNRNACMRKCALHGFYGHKDRKAKWEILNQMARSTQAVRFARKIRFPVTPVRVIIIMAFLIRHPRVLRSI